MTTETIDHSTLRELADAGGIDETHVKNTGQGWVVIIRSGHRTRQLTTNRSRQARVFKRLETLTGYLVETGIKKFDVDAQAFVAGATSSTRPDLSRALKARHEAAAYDAWFRQQIQEAIDDPSPAIPHAEVKAHFDRKKADLIASMSPEEQSQLAALRLSRRKRG